MSLSEQFFEEDLHPIDVVQNIATHNEWDFDRIADDQIAMSVEGQWRTYSVTLAWSGYDETLRMVCTFEMEPPAEKLPALYELLNLVNDQLLGRRLYLLGRGENDGVPLWSGAGWWPGSGPRAG